MKRVLGGLVRFCAGVLISLISFPLVCGSPSRFSLFQGSAYSSSVSRQRNKNWCAFVVQRNVTCAVLSANEKVSEPQLLPCRPHQPDCTPRLTYHTHTRPMYKIGYKQVTELEWRCCPGHQGHDCTELKDALQKAKAVEEPRQDAAPIHSQQQSMLGPEVFSETHPWMQPGAKGHRGGQPGDYGDRQRDSHRVQALEDEVERLSQTVLDLQAMTSANANLRLDLQEDVTKFVLNMLGNLHQPQDVKAGETESFVVPSDLRSSSVADDLQNHISTNTDNIHDLQVKIQNIDGQLHRLTEAAGAGSPPPAAAAGECLCRAYIDEKISALREELLQGIDIKMADMKNACDYKVLSVQEQCEEQESSYLSLAELLDSKEDELRKEIQDLRLRLPAEKAPEADRREVQKLKDAQQMLKEDQRLDVVEKHTKQLQDEVGSFVQQMKNDLNQSKRFEVLRERIEALEEGFGNNQEQVTEMSGLLNGLGGRLASIEGVCGGFEPMSDSLKRIKDGLNKHVSGLWTCVRQLNSTVRTHTRDINMFKANAHSSKDGQDGITDAPLGVLKGTATVKSSLEGSRALPSLSAVASGAAGARITKVSSHTPQGINGSGTSMTGYAGAPGYPPIPAAALSPESVSAQIPLKTVQMAAGEGRVMRYVSFSAGLTRVPFPGATGNIRFNNVLLNDGQHYDPHTGVFTVPVDGRYLLSAVLTAPAGERVEAFLSVADRNIQKLHTSASEDCVCGGSASASLVLHLKRGQRTGLVLTAGQLAISASSEILSSFSAALLYPTLTQR